MKIQARQFGGIIPRSEPRNLPDGAAQTAENVKLWKGTLKPWGGPGSAILDGVDNPVCIYRFKQNEATTDADQWWVSANELSVARGPIFDDTEETTFFTEKSSGTYYLRETDTTRESSGTPGTIEYWSTTVPTPASAPSPAIYGTEDTKTDKEDRVYIYTYVNAKGREGNPSAESGIVTVRQNSSTPVGNGHYSTYYVNLTLTLPANVTAERMWATGAEIRVYCGGYELSQQLVGVLECYEYDVVNHYFGWRIKSGFTSNSTLYAAVLSGSTTTPGGSVVITDKLLSGGRGENCPSGDWEPAPSDAYGLKCLKSMPNGLFVGIHKNNICFCDPYHPHAWPLTHRHGIDYAPIALGVYGNTVVVATNGYPYVITGTEPTAMVPQKLERQQSCASARSMVDLGGGVAYASPDGLVVVDGSGLNVASEKWYSRDEWQALNPSTIHAVAWDGRYVMFCDPTGNGTWDTGIVWDFNTGPTTLNLAGGDVRALYADLKYDKLYYANSAGQVFRFDYDQGSNNQTWSASKTYAIGDIVTYNGAYYQCILASTNNAPPNGTYWVATSGRITFTWKSKKYEHPQPVNYGCAQIHANAYDNGTTQDLNLKVYADGVLKYDQPITSRTPVRLPSGFKAREWEFEVSGNVEVFGIDIATNMQELMNG